VHCRAGLANSNETRRVRRSQWHGWESLSQRERGGRERYETSARAVAQRVRESERKRRVSECGTGGEGEIREIDKGGSREIPPLPPSSG